MISFHWNDSWNFEWTKVVVSSDCIGNYYCFVFGIVAKCKFCFSFWTMDETSHKVYVTSMKSLWWCQKCRKNYLLLRVKHFTSGFHKGPLILAFGFSKLEIFPNVQNHWKPIITWYLKSHSSPQLWLDYSIISILSCTHPGSQLQIRFFRKIFLN